MAPGELRKAKKRELKLKKKELMSYKAYMDLLKQESEDWDGMLKEKTDDNIKCHR